MRVGLCEELSPAVGGGHALGVVNCLAGCEYSRWHGPGMANEKWERDSALIFHCFPNLLTVIQLLTAVVWR